MLYIGDADWVNLSLVSFISWEKVGGRETKFA